MSESISISFQDRVEPQFIGGFRLRKETFMSGQKRSAGTRSWVPWVFVLVGPLGVIWLVLYYVAGDSIPGMRVLGQWNFLIGILLILLFFPALIVAIIVTGANANRSRQTAAQTQWSGTANQSVPTYAMVKMPDGSQQVMPVVQSPASTMTPSPVTS